MGLRVVKATPKTCGRKNVKKDGIKLICSGWK
jgi:hypothetical protein